MLDMHAHVLPGVDDGARDEAEARDMLCAAAAVGVRTLVATPHVRSQDTDRGAHRRAYDAILPFALEQGIALVLGAELNIRAALMVQDISPYCFALPGSHQQYLLLELRNEQSTPELPFLLSEWREQGIVVIIAHPERYVYVQKQPKIVQQWQGLGALLQVDAEAFLYPWWSSQRRTVNRLHADHRIDLVGSDAHRTAQYGCLPAVHKRWKKRRVSAHNPMGTA